MGATLELYLMSPPGPRWALRGRANFRSQDAAPVDAAAARREWLTLARRIEAHGGTVLALPSPSEALTGMPYAAECGQLLTTAEGRLQFLLPRMASAHRRAEREPWSRFLASVGASVQELPGEGIWEAQGDVATFEGVTLLFHGGRTTLEGMQAAARFFPGEVLRLQVREPAFHGNMALLPLEAVGQLLVVPDVFEAASLEALGQRFGRERLHPVREDELRAYATNGLPVGKTVLAPSVAPPRVVALMRKLGMDVELLPMPELCEKGGGASRCLVSHARVDASLLQLPAAHRLEALAPGLESPHARAGG